MSASHTRFSAATTTKLERAMENGLAASTQRNYNSFIKKYLEFCSSENISRNASFPADELVLCAFVATFVGEKSGSTASAAIAALKAYHRLHGVEWKGGYLLSHVLKGAATLAPPSSRLPPRPPVTIQMLQILRSGLIPNSPFDAAVFAAALVTFWGQCRLGELLGTSRTRHDPHHFPSRTSFTPASSHSSSRSAAPLPGASLHLPCTKTHQISGQTIHLASQRDGLSPIAAVQLHFHVNSQIPGSHHLFAHKSHDGQIRCLTREDFLDRCNEIWSNAGFPHFSGHSFRIGGTHAYLSSGVPSDVVKTMGRWASDAYLKYWRSIGSIVDLHAKNITSASPTPNPRPRPGTRRRHTRQ